MSAITSELINAYQNTHYQVLYHLNRHTLRIDEPSEFLINLLNKHDATEAVYITACNPYSQSTSPIDNKKRLKQLKQDIDNRWIYFEGEGVDPSGEWTPESSLLVIGMPTDIATELATKYGQNAYLYCEIDSENLAIPRLVLLS